MQLITIKRLKKIKEMNGTYLEENENIHPEIHSLIRALVPILLQEWRKTFCFREYLNEARIGIVWMFGICFSRRQMLQQEKAHWILLSETV